MLCNWFLIFVLFIGCSDNEQPQSKEINYSVTDDLGKELVFSSLPKKVITLAPNLTEMIFYINEGNRLIGNTTYCDFPEAAKRITNVGDMLSVNYEKILSLNPDLVFITVEGNNKESYEKMIQLDIKVFVSNPRDYNGIKKTFSDFGKIFNKEEMTDSILSGWDNSISSVVTDTSIFKGKTAMILVALKPVMLAGNNTFLNEFLKLLHIKNIAEDSKMNYPIFNREEVLKRDPDMIIFPADDVFTQNDIKDNYPEWKNLKAIKNEMVFIINPNLLLRPGPRFAEALKTLADNIKSKM